MQGKPGKEDKPKKKKKNKKYQSSSDDDNEQKDIQENQATAMDHI